MNQQAWAAAEAAARASYGRLLAYLAARSGDLAGAEDALAEAFAAALASWPTQGVPERPEAWLLTAARRRLGHGARHHRVRAAAAAPLAMLAEAASAREAPGIPDERLALLFVCAHPAIEPAMHTPLMLQVVLGLDAQRVGAAFLVAPAAMGQRLVRAKAKIRDAGIRFAVPEPEHLAERLAPVLEAIYAAFGTGWEGAASGGGGLADEAVWLARLTAALLPEEPEALGLLALLLHCRARQAARRQAGGFVPLSEQDTRLWSAPMIAEAEAVLLRASALGRMGRFQLEAAIQSAHAARARGLAVDWAGIATLYGALLALAPTLGARVAHAAAVGEAAGAADGLRLLEAIEGASAYQPWWAVRAHLLARLGRAGAGAAYAEAARLSGDPAVRGFLAGRAKRLLLL